MKGKVGGLVIGKANIYCLKFADDITIVTDTAGELKEMIEKLESYCAKNKLQVNTKKMNVLVLRKGGRQIQIGVLRGRSYKWLKTWDSNFQ